MIMNRSLKGLLEHIKMKTLCSITLPMVPVRQPLPCYLPSLLHSPLSTI